MLAQLSAFDVRVDALGTLRERYEERLALLEQELAAARAAREAGHHDQAVEHYNAAAQLVADRPDIAAARRAAIVDRQVARHVSAGRLAMDQGDYGAASEAFRQAMAVRADEQVDALLRAARGALHRQAVYEALDRDDRSAAIEHLQQLLHIDPDDTSAAILQRLEFEHVEATLARSIGLHDAGRTPEAVDLLEATTKDFPDQRLMELRGAIRSDALVKQAVAAEKSGEYGQARELYLDALAAGGDRAAVAERIDDVEIIAALESQIEEYQRIVESFESDLEAREQALSALREKREFLETRLADAQQMMDRLENGLRYWREEAERYREAYEQERRR
jgi:tetratricopeptide (TPR) repeat protein